MKWQASPADAAALSEIEHLASSYPWSLSQIIQSCRHPEQQVFVIGNQRQQVYGFAILQCVVDEATLLNIAVTPVVQGQGYGKQLLDVVIEEAMNVASTRLLLEVRCSNESAIALYRSYGFRDDGIRKNYYPADDGREDALLMSLELTY